MSPKLAARDADKGLGVHRYQRHQSEQTLLYQLIEQHYPAFITQLAAQGTILSGYVQRLKRVFNIDIETCGKCGGSVKLIACIVDPVVIEKIINHLKERETVSGEPTRLPESRAPRGISSYQDSACKGVAREHRYFRRETQPINLPAIYKSSYNTSSDFNGLSSAKVANSRCLKLCYKNAMACDLQCANQYKNMSHAKPCFNQCRRGAGTCVEICTY